MTLPTVVQGSLRPSLQITWLRQGTQTPEDLTAATLTGSLRASGATSITAIAGALTVTDGANGVFRWDLAAADVATAGSYMVEFVATFASGASPAKTFSEGWTVAKSLSGG